MKKAAMVLGIIGGALTILISLFYIIMFAALGTLTGTDFDYFEYSNDIFDTSMKTYQEVSLINAATPIDQAGAAASMASFICIFIFGFILLGGGLGLAGGILAEKKSVMAGVFMLVASVLSVFYCITFILLLLGGIFALVKSRDTAPPPAPQYPAIQ